MKAETNRLGVAEGLCAGRKMRVEQIVSNGFALSGLNVISPGYPGLAPWAITFRPVGAASVTTTFERIRATWASTFRAVGAVSVTTTFERIRAAWAITFLHVGAAWALKGPRVI